MANYTPNYGLHQWEPGDNFLRTDFNADFAKLDAAIKGVADTAESKKADKSALAEVRTLAESKCRIAMGSYVGNGTKQTIPLGARAKVVFIIYGMYTYMASEEHSNFGLASEAEGFSVDSNNNANRDLNQVSCTFHYVALL